MFTVYHKRVAVTTSTYQFLGGCMPTVLTPPATTQRSRAHTPTVDPAIVKKVSAKMMLRDFQEAAVRKFLANLRTRSRVKVISIPTGGGKTRIGVAVVACLLQAGYNVVWVCKRWKLLRMAEQEFTRHFPKYTGVLRRIGGASRRYELGKLPDGPGGSVVFTTLQTWFKKRGNLPNANPQSGPWIPIWDEVQWGFASEIGRTFCNTYLPHANILGLTATPPQSNRRDVIYEKSFADLVGTVLATPTIESVITDVAWTPELESWNDDFSEGSLDVLARHPKRNRLIVGKIAKLRSDGHARHILVFAVNIEHAQELVKLLGTRNIPARMVHSRQSQRDQDEAISLFEVGKIDVLVNVAMLAEGFDFPPIDAVLLARPTRSNGLLTQMIGRGARKAPGKDTFIVMDFTDNLRRHAEGVARASSLYPSFVATPARHRVYHPPTQHIEPATDPRFENYTIANYGTILIALGLTFGGEIELTSRNGIPKYGREWRKIARALIKVLKQFVTAPVHPVPLRNKVGPLDAWRVKYDASAGWEIVSPILMNAKGFDELQLACKAIENAIEDSDGDLRVNYRTGLHITLATRLNTDPLIRGFMKLVQRLEPGLFTLVAPSRLYTFNPKTKRYAKRAGNQYCRPLRELGDPDHINLDQFVARHDNRYRSVNLIKSKGDIPLLEVRMHHGTFEFRKIALWLSLWMQIFNTARYGSSSTAEQSITSPTQRSVFPGRNQRTSKPAREDIVKLLKAEGIEMPPEFVALLRGRLRELRKSWLKVLPNRVDRWKAAGMYATDATQSLGS